MKEIILNDNQRTPDQKVIDWNFFLEQTASWKGRFTVEKSKFY